MKININSRYDILTPTGFVNFTKISKSNTKLQRIKIGGKTVFASKRHMFVVNGQTIPLKKLPKRCYVDVGSGRKLLVKTNNFVVKDAYDVIGVNNQDHLYYIENQIVTHNCDEFAFVRDNIAEEFWTSVSPTLATGGACIICSTPNGDTNRFAQLWHGANLDINGFKPIAVKWNEPPGRDEEFKRREIAKIGTIRWEQEYEVQFISNDPLLVDTLVLANLTTEVENIKPIGVLEDIKFFKHPQAGATYLIGMDVATGSGSDFTTLEVFEFPSLDQIAEFRSNTTSSVICYNMLKKLIRVLEKADSTVYYSVENNGVGEAIIALIEADEDPPETAEFISESGQKRLGMTTTGKSKVRTCMILKEMVERRQIGIKSRMLIEELKHYVRTGGSYAAKPGRTDDLIAGLLIAIRILGELSSFDQTAYDKLYSHSFMDNEAGGYDINEYDDSDHSPDFVI